MSIAAALNDHIRRLAKREINAATRSTRRLTAQYRRDIAALKRQVTALRRTVGFLEAQEKRRAAALPVAEKTEKARFRADGLVGQRKRLGLSAGDYGRLVGVTGTTVRNWEGGRSKPKQEQVQKLAALRDIGKREALKRLELLGK